MKGSEGVLAIVLHVTMPSLVLLYGVMLSRSSRLDSLLCATAAGRRESWWSQISPTHFDETMLRNKSRQPPPMSHQLHCPAIATNNRAVELV